MSYPDKSTLYNGRAFAVRPHRRGSGRVWIVYRKSDPARAVSTHRRLTQANDDAAARDGQASN